MAFKFIKMDIDLFEKDIDDFGMHLNNGIWQSRKCDNCPEMGFLGRCSGKAGVFRVNLMITIVSLYNGFLLSISSIDCPACGTHIDIQYEKR